MSSEIDPSFKLAVAKAQCERSHIFFTRYFFKYRHAIKFRVNWHHLLISDAIEEVINGKTENLIINVAPGASKTEIVVINFIARGLALNPNARFLHLSGSDSLASLNSQAARECVLSDEFQQFWPLKIAEDAKAKKRWNVEINNRLAGGVYATALGGQVTGFRAGHMQEGFQGAIIIDDPIKPEDAFSRSKLDAANRKLLTTVKSRKANPKTPIVIVMQRIAENDASNFAVNNLPGKWKVLKIPALIDEKYLQTLPERYQTMVDRSEQDEQHRVSYWPYKEPLKELLTMERGEGVDATGARINRHVFSSQYNQAPVALGGNIIHGANFERYLLTPKIKYRKIFVDTAQKTKERNDFSVFAEWGLGVDGKVYLLDLIRGKWEAPDLQKHAVAFWAKAKSKDVDKFGQLREMPVEDKVSGTGLIQTLRRPPYMIPVKEIEREKDKLTRVMDVLPYIEVQAVCIPEAAPFTTDFVAECEAFTADDSHDHDDQVDTMVDAITDLMSPGNNVRIFEKLAKG